MENSTAQFDSCSSCDDMELFSLVFALVTFFRQKMGHDVAEIAIKCTSDHYVVSVRACSESNLDEGTSNWKVKYGSGNENDLSVTHFSSHKNKDIVPHFDASPQFDFSNKCEPVIPLVENRSIHEVIGQGQFRAESIGEYLVKFIESNEKLQVRRENHETNLQIRRENHEINMILCYPMYTKVTKKREQYERRHKRTVKWFGYFMKNKEMLPFDEWWIRHSPARFDPILTLEKYRSMYISTKNRNIDINLRNEPLASPNAEQSINSSETEPLLNNCA